MSFYLMHTKERNTNILFLYQLEVVCNSTKTKLETKREKIVHLKEKRISNSSVLSEDNSCVVYCRWPTRKIQDLQAVGAEFIYTFFSCRVTDETAHTQKKKQRKHNQLTSKSIKGIFESFCCCHTEMYSRGCARCTENMWKLKSFSLARSPDTDALFLLGK